MQLLYDASMFSVARLSFEEFMGEESRATRLFRLMDKDGDGFVTKSVIILPSSQKGGTQ